MQHIRRTQYGHVTEEQSEGGDVVVHKVAGLFDVAPHGTLEMIPSVTMCTSQATRDSGRAEHPGAGLVPVDVEAGSGREEAGAFL